MFEDNVKEYFLAYVGTEFKGFYISDIHKNIPTNTIKITEDLWKCLLNFNGIKLKLELSSIKDLYDISDKDLFCEDLPDISEIPQSPLQRLENENAELLLNSVQKEIEISNLQSDIANILLQLGGNVQ